MASTTRPYPRSCGKCERNKISKSYRVMVDIADGNSGR
jgi:hypothetical protein